MMFSEFVDLCKDYPLIRSNLFPLITNKPSSLRRQVTQWQQKGWLLELKRGFYVIADLLRRSPSSNLFLSNYLVTPSYVSLETALSYYQLIPEKVEAITCITSKKTQRFNTPLAHFIYRHVKQSSYSSFVTAIDEFNRQFYIATPEKALVDYLYFHTAHLRKVPTDYFSESMRLQNTERLVLHDLLTVTETFNQKKLNETVNTLIQHIENSK